MNGRAIGRLPARPAEPPRFVRRVLAAWRERQVAVLLGGFDPEIVEFERRSRVLLPCEVLEFNRWTNGTLAARTGEDKRGFYFRRLEDLQPFEDTPHIFYFVEFLQGMHQYGVELSTGTDRAATAAVYGVGQATARLTATFEAFIDDYIADAPRLYPSYW